MRYVLIPKFEQLSGYSRKAIEKKIESGVWIEGRQFLRAPDGHIMIDVEGVEAWVEGQLAPSKPGRNASGSSSRTLANAA